MFPEDGAELSSVSTTALELVATTVVSPEEKLKV
jgi:hypothetical protein